MSRMTTVGIVGLAITLGITASLVAAQEKPTPEFQALMQRAGATAQSIGQHIEASDYDGIAADAATIREVFMEVGAFFNERNVQSALEACGMTYEAAGQLAEAAEAHDDDAIGAARGAMFGGCQSCHTAHRQEDPDGGYFINID